MQGYSLRGRKNSPQAGQIQNKKSLAHHILPQEFLRTCFQVKFKRSMHSGSSIPPGFIPGLSAKERMNACIYKWDTFTIPKIHGNLTNRKEK